MSTVVIKPWGHYVNLLTQPTYLVKQIIVKPQHRLSLQIHRCRSEHWVITQGIATVQIGEDLLTLHPNQSCYIPKGCKHRIHNETSEDLIFIECQIGDCDENDITRLEDDYKRCC